MNNAIWQNENHNPPEFHAYDEDCDCNSCKEDRPEMCECGAELKSTDIDYCKLCI